MDSDGPRSHRHGKGGGKPFLFLRPQIRISAQLFYAFLLLSSSPRKMRKKAGQNVTSVAVAMAVRRSPWCITVCSRSFVLILCYLLHLETFACACALTFLCIFLQYNTNQTISRFYALTPKITYLGHFLTCMVRCPRKVVVCELCAQDCGGFGEGLPMFFVVLCDDVVCELCAREIHSLSA